MVSILRIAREVRRAVGKTKVWFYSILPNVDDMIPPTKEELDAWKARRNPNTLWADEMEYATGGETVE